MAQRTITRAYDSYAAATTVIRALEGAGIPHSDISLVGRDGAQSGPVGTTGTGTSGTGTGLAHDTETEKGAGTGATIGTVLGAGAGQRPDQAAGVQLLDDLVVLLGCGLVRIRGGEDEDAVGLCHCGSLSGRCAGASTHTLPTGDGPVVTCSR